MPQNLNALIRYKQIDLCLRSPYLKATIEVLQQKCSDQLKEHRGVYKLVSERTIRDDIRVMRSSALGFEAPIVVKDGAYTYEDPNYSIFNTAIHDLDILTTLTELLVKEKKHLKNPALLEMIERLKEITGVEEVLMLKSVQRKDMRDQELSARLDDVFEAARMPTDEPYFSWSMFFDLEKL
jgi:hypothetical protein